LEDIKTRAKKRDDDESSKTSERAREAAANDQRLAGTCSQSAMNDSGAHGSILGGAPANGYRFRELQEIEAAKYRRGITLLHDAAAGAAGILSVNFAAGFHQNGATTGWTHAMPALPEFHDHGPSPPFGKTAARPQR
jgi:hypothetical protein